jgi:glycosyltransferase involved in cell wall biosynthesis
MGHDVAIFAYYGLKGAPLEWEGLPVYPGMSDGFGNDVITSYALNHFKGDRGAGWLLLQQDVWTVTSEKLRDLHVAAWAPVDHTPAPPKVIEFFTRNGAVPIAQSQHGERMFREAGLDPMYVPIGLDTGLFAPRPHKREEMREAMELPQDAFVFGMVAQNSGSYPSRKAFPEVFQAFAAFQRKHPSAVLYVHSVASKMHTGIELHRLAKACDVPESAIVFVDQFGYVIGEITPDAMVDIYSAIDVLVNPAYGEGFGMAIIEAQACGVPVILADNTSMPELCGGGWLVPCSPMWDEDQRSWWGRVQVSDLVATMEKAYHVSDKVKRQARGFILAGYDIEHVMANYWKPTLEVLEGMLTVPEASPVDLSKL